MLSSPLAGFGKQAFGFSARTNLSNFFRSSCSSKPPNVHTNANKNNLSSSNSTSLGESESLAFVESCCKSVKQDTTELILERLITGSNILPNALKKSDSLMYRVNNSLRIGICVSCCLQIQLSSTGPQSKSVSLIYMMPALDTVAGEALFKSSVSNTNLTFSVIGILSPFARVKILLSSKTVFKFSIQIASTGPSQISQVLSLLVRSLNFCQSEANTPSTHSLLTGSVSPNISSARIALGFIWAILFGVPVK
mmetsp:Transcript_26881/g.43270  ORF Transcript_26881/g.43270 Transcript_26881/m.43270 type:complete len:252 (-) Transcript_26881:3976-4731(-)